MPDNDCITDPATHMVSHTKGPNNSRPSLPTFHLNVATGLFSRTSYFCEPDTVRSDICATVLPCQIKEGANITSKHGRPCNS